MDRLPSELLLSIFRYIRENDCRARSRLELVCRRWHKIMRDHGWKHIRRLKLQKLRWIGPIGALCGGHLVECNFSKVDINSTLIQRIAESFPALRHLDFRHCNLIELNVANAQEPFRALGVHLRSLTFFDMFCQSLLNLYLLCHLSRLRHLGLHIYQYTYKDGHIVAVLPGRFFADLRSLYLSSLIIPDILIKLKRDCPRITALYLDTIITYSSEQQQQLLSRISDLNNLRFLRIALDFQYLGSESLSSCLLDLFALKLHLLNVPIKRILDVFRSLPFRALVHLSLSLSGHLSSFAPQLRSFCLDITAAYSMDLAYRIGYEMLKIAENGILEYLNVPDVSFTVGILKQLIQLCPNLHSLCARLDKSDQLRQVSELRRIVADQWRAGTRMNLPLRVWIYGRNVLSAVFLQDPFLAIRTVPYGFTPPNPVLEALFRDEVFIDGGETPSFVTEHYSSMA